jgi:hypothetical protein
MANDENLLPATSPSVFRDSRGRLDSSRLARGREFAEELLSDPKYRENLKARIHSGKAPVLEQYYTELLFGKVPKPKEESTDDELQLHFERLRGELNHLLQAHPELAKALSAVVAKRSARLLLPAPESPHTPEQEDDAIL